jgi:hypothetical protein
VNHVKVEARQLLAATRLIYINHECSHVVQIQIKIESLEAFAPKTVYLSHPSPSSDAFDIQMIFH